MAKTAAKAQKGAKAPTKVAKKPAKAAAKAPAATAPKAVVIVSSKACQAFAKRATGLSAAIKAAKPSASVTIDEQKPEGRNPDRGSFVVSVGGKEVVACRGMPRPFTAMKALDMDKVAKDVIALL
jgi:hypothetical protein